MRHSLVLAIVLHFVVCLRTSNANDYWPGWLGPNRNGWVESFTPPKKWPAKLKQVWKVEVGSGYGSPLVADGRVYQHGRIGDDEVVQCFNLKSGELKWRKADSVPFKMGGGGEWHGKGPKASPVLSASKLFTLSITGTLTARDRESGEKLWTKDYGTRFEGGRDGNSHPYWGATTSPIVDGDRVLMHFGTDKEGILAALDVKTGDEVWTLGNDGASYSSPLVVEIHGVRQVIDWTHEALIGVEAKTGVELWRFPFPHLTVNQNMPTPVFHQGRILLGCENRGIHSVEPKLSGDDWSVESRWFQKQVPLDMSTAVMNDDLLYGLSHYGKGRLFCLDTESGDVLWQGPGRTGANVTFLSVPGYVFALTDSGHLRVIAANPKAFTLVADYQVATSPTWAPPVLVSNGILIKDGKTLALWSFPAI